MQWFKRRKSIEDKSKKREIPDGLWIKCDGCGEILYKKQIEKNLMVCPKCNHHFRVNSPLYKTLLLDEGTFGEKDENLLPADPLTFKDYQEKIKKSRKKTFLNDAIVCGEGKIKGRDVEICIMDFNFIGGTMGSVVGEKVKRAIQRASDKGLPLIIVTATGGARMQEGMLSLMQMAKTAAALNRLHTPFISILTYPSTAGVLASYASLGDVIIAEPGAHIGFAGPRVIEQTIKRELPEGFQRSEFMLEHGFVDMVVHRKDLRDTVDILLNHLY
ncbi:acetyl-CoA carboxylase carboxyltransferase subunit beta [candidate division WOR-3 bacterium]|nr:acetyl-CoA carboxylase carboxyltransferase subunit beta [candidate division WOR-3 bacterium]